jgi:hypothetical protein
MGLDVFRQPTRTSMLRQSLELHHVRGRYAEHRGQMRDDLRDWPSTLLMMGTRTLAWAADHWFQLAIVIALLLIADQLAALGRPANSAVTNLAAMITALRALREHAGRKDGNGKETCWLGDRLRRLRLPSRGRLTT